MATVSLAHLVVRVGLILGTTEGGVVSTGDSSLPTHTGGAGVSAVSSSPPPVVCSVVAVSADLLMPINRGYWEAIWE